MSVDENVFFREATLRICSSLDIETALKRCFEYIRAFIPVIGMSLHILDPDLNLLRFVASVGHQGSTREVPNKSCPCPRKAGDERAGDLQARALLTRRKGPNYEPARPGS